MIRRKLIRTKVRSLLSSAGITEAPVDVEAIAKRIGIDVRKAEFTPADKLSGILYRDSGRTVIGVNSAHPSARQRFTIAHEIGHSVLEHSDSLYVDRNIPRSLVMFRDSRSEEGIIDHEIEANAFAAELLMPSDFLARDISSMETADADKAISDLADRYRVSEQAMTIRLTNLGYLKS